MYPNAAMKKPIPIFFRSLLNDSKKKKKGSWGDVTAMLDSDKPSKCQKTKRFLKFLEGIELKHCRKVEQKERKICGKKLCSVIFSEDLGMNVFLFFCQELEAVGEMLRSKISSEKEQISVLQVYF